MFSKKIITINDGKIIESNNDLVSISKNIVLNTTEWFFSSNDLDSLDQVVNEFMMNNKKYIISYNDMSIEKLLVNVLFKKELVISFAESCTGGLLAATLVNVSGSSNVFNESYVTYSNNSKVNILGVKNATIKKYSVYSPEVAEEMATGLYNKTQANICVSITGRAGGDEYSEGDGTYDFAIYVNAFDKDYLHVEHATLNGKRNDVRRMQVNYIFYKILTILNRF